MTEAGQKVSFWHTVRAAFITHVVFAIINIALVVTNIFLPRLLNQPNSNIEAVFAIVDENELDLSQEQMRLLDQNIQMFGTKCLDILRAVGMPRACINEISKHVKYLKIMNEETSSKLSHELEFWELFANQDSENRRRMISETDIRSIRVDEYVGFVGVSDIIKSEHIENFSESMIIQHARQVRSELEQLKGEGDIIANLLLSIDKHNSDPPRSGEVFFEVIIANNGNADTVISPNALLSIGGKIVQIQKRLGSLTKYNYGLDTNPYSVLAANSVIVIRYEVDLINSTSAGKDALDAIIQSRAPSEFSISVDASGRELVKSGHFPTNEMSLELQEF